MDKYKIIDRVLLLVIILYALITAIGFNNIGYDANNSGLWELINTLNLHACRVRPFGPEIWICDTNGSKFLILGALIVIYIFFKKYYTKQRRRLEIKG